MMNGKTKTLLYTGIGLLVAILACIAVWLVVPSALKSNLSGKDSTPTSTLDEKDVLPQTAVIPATSTSEANQATATMQSADTKADTGWQAEYYDDRNFEEPPALEQIDADIDFDWKDGSPTPGLPVDNFSVRWRRCLTLEERYYIFVAQADDYVRIFVDEIAVGEAALFVSLERPFAISAGRHCIKVEYREEAGAALVNVSFKAGEAFALAEEGTAWKGEYFNNSDFLDPVAYTRNDPTPVFDWKESNPAPNIPIDNFSVRWTRCMDFEGRDYIFTVRADDHARGLLDDIQVLESAPNANVETPFAVPAGRHCIKIEYREDAGPASIYVDIK
jgi:hypothetical protein